MAKRTAKSPVISAGMEAMMAEIVSRLSGDFKLPNLPGKMTGLERAQDLMWDAFDTSDSKKRVTMANEALAMSPLCADAYVLLGRESAAGDTQRLELFRKGVEAGAKAVGKRAFKEDVGMFRGILETRPYMRALHELAGDLWRGGEHDQSLVHYNDMLRLNPNDNQGVRYELLDHLLELGREAEAKMLIKA